GVAAELGHAGTAAVAEQDVHGNAGTVGPVGRNADSPRQVANGGDHQAMALVVGRRSVFAVKIVGIDGRIGERNLVIVRIIHRFGEGVGTVQLVAATQALVDREPECVVVRVDA